MRSIPEFMLVNGLVDLTRYGAQEYAHLYDPTLWNQVSFTGGVYGIPQDSGPMGMFYQPAVLAKVGATPPATWNDWAEVAGSCAASTPTWTASPWATPQSLPHSQPRPAPNGSGPRRTAGSST